MVIANKQISNKKNIQRLFEEYTSYFLYNNLMVNITKREIFLQRYYNRKEFGDKKKYGDEKEYSKIRKYDHEKEYDN